MKLVSSLKVLLGAAADWGNKLGFIDSDLVEMNSKAVELLFDIREEYESPKTQIVISGCVGPRSDGYIPANYMSAKEAEIYHLPQIKALSDANSDMITAITMTYAEEAIGVIQASQLLNMPVIISFTVETDGRLPSGQTLKDAINMVDKETKNAPLYYMINCAHPTHFGDILEADEPWT